VNKGIGRFLCFCLCFCLLSGPVLEAAGQNKIKMSFTDAPIGLVLQALGKLTGTSFTISSQAGNKLLSIEMDGVPFSAALDMIAQAGGVTIRSSGPGRYVVYSKEETGEGAKTEKQKEIQGLEDMLSKSVMEVIPVKYVSVSDVEGAINTTIGNGSESVVKVTKLENGSDRSYRSIVVYAASKRVLDIVRKVVKQIDIPKPMVEIEILFAEVSLGDNDNFGFNWKPLASPITFTERRDDTMGVFTLGDFTRNAITAEAALASTFGKNNAKILACPKLRVMSGYKAVFKSETEQPIPQKDSDGNWSVTWKDVGISLEMLPVVMGDGTIQMSVRPKASTITSFVTQGTITAPVISKRETDTQVFLRPGEIMAISGLINDTEIKNMSKVPILGDLPVLGALFKSHDSRKERSNVIVMLRPRLVDVSKENAAPVDEGKKIDEWKKSIVSPDADTRGLVKPQPPASGGSKETQPPASGGSKETQPLVGTPVRGSAGAQPQQSAVAQPLVGTGREGTPVRAIAQPEEEADLTKLKEGVKAGGETSGGSKETQPPASGGNAVAQPWIPPLE